MKVIAFLITVHYIIQNSFAQDRFVIDRQQVKDISFESYNITDNTRYFLYDVNIGEGTNLRRDVYTRVAIIVRKLHELTGNDWILVLPEWRQLYHWKSKRIEQKNIPWGQYFDLKNMNLFTPVMEFETFWNNIGHKNGIDYFLYLKYPSDMIKTNGTTRTLKDKIGISKSGCETNERKEGPQYMYKDEKDNVWRGYAFHLRKYVYAKKMDCLDFVGHTKNFLNFIDKNLTEYKSIFFDHMEKVSLFYPHENFFKDQARRSLVLSKHLRVEADKFRAKYLDSTDENDKTHYNDNDYRLHVPTDSSAIGGPYISVHMRLNDWKNAHKKKIPSIEELAVEINKNLEKLNLNKVYVATDGTAEEVDELRSYLNDGVTVYRYPTNRETVLKYSDMGIAVMDQWICAHAKYFIGTCGSTFTYRIEEERDILAFDNIMTYQTCICGKQLENKDQCNGRKYSFPDDHRIDLEKKRIEQANELRNNNDDIKTEL